MRRTDLSEAVMRAWARLNEPQRQRFFEMFLSAAVRLDKLELRAWLRRRLREPPLVAIDPALRAAGEAAAEPDRDEAKGG